MGPRYTSCPFFAECFFPPLSAELTKTDKSGNNLILQEKNGKRRTETEENGWRIIFFICISIYYDKTMAQFCAILKFQYVTRMKNCVILRFHIVNKKSPFNEMCSMAGRAGRNLPVFLRTLKNHFDAGNLTWQDAIVLFLPRSVPHSPSALYGSTTSPESMRVAPGPRGLFFWRLDWNCR